MTLARIVKVSEFTAMITQTNWIQNMVIDTIKEQEAPRSIKGHRAKGEGGKSFPDAITLLHRCFC